jgi:serine protease inhibitor ecotin
MNSSYSTDPYSQSSQFRPATSSQVHYQNPTTARSNPAQPRTAPPPLEAKSPRSIAELAEITRQSLGEDTRPFKIWLQIAETARRDAKSFQEKGDLEASFIEFARAATIVLEKIPSHPDYRVLLTPTQIHNVGLVSYLDPLHFACHQSYHPVVIRIYRPILLMTTPSMLVWVLQNAT